MAKRKRDLTAPKEDRAVAVPPKKSKPEPKASSAAQPKPTSSAVREREAALPTIQIVAGSYDRVLHGILAILDRPPSSDLSTSPSSSTLTSAAAATTDDKNGHSAPESPAAAAAETVRFVDTFLFNAHSSAIRCVAVSPPSAPVPGQTQKVLLATGATDERINVYQLSAHPPSAARARAAQQIPSASSLVAGGAGAAGTTSSRSILENPENREMGTLLHHAGAVTQLAFPTRGKLLSAAEDSTIAVTRTRDWSLLSTVRVPVAKPAGRPSGDTAALGAAPKGVNGFAVHPSLKLMISVSKGERAMRLWNLVTGKKAGVLNFGRALLAQIGETKLGTGEGRGVAWGGSAAEGDEFAVAFDRDVVVFGMDSRPRCRVMRDARTKVHAMAYLRRRGGGGEKEKEKGKGKEKEEEEDDEDAVLAVSTEDGRIVFCSTRTADLEPAARDGELPTARTIAQLGGRGAGVTSRIKDFAALAVDGGEERVWYIVTGSSDGTIRLWKVGSADLRADGEADGEEDGAAGQAGQAGKVRQVGRLLGTYQTPDRITCVAAFVMIPRPEGVEDSDGGGSGDDDDEEGAGEDSHSASDSDDEED